MYKIYINDTPLIIDTIPGGEIPVQGNTDNLVLQYNGKRKHILQVIDMLEKSSRFTTVTLYAKDKERLFEEFQKIFKRIDAAGGVVFNRDEEALVIFRRGYWDLPKGKIDKGETIEEAAVREVEEETGLKNVELKENIGETWHTYKMNEKRVLKKTSWFKMYSEDTQLILQTEEDIEEGKWVKIPDFMKSVEKIYSNIRMVLQKAGGG